TLAFEPALHRLDDGPEAHAHGAVAAHGDLQRAMTAIDLGTCSHAHPFPSCSKTPGVPRSCRTEFVPSRGCAITAGHAVACAALRHFPPCRRWRPHGLRRLPWR